MANITRFLRQLISIHIMLYQILIRPVIRPSCRFYPSCSDYALSAINYHGVAKGIKLTICRLLRCHPWTEGGYDPVLPNEEKI